MTAVAMSTIYKLCAVESSLEAVVFSALREAGLLPSDTWTEGVGDGHNVAFFSNDKTSCAAVNDRIPTCGYFPVRLSPSRSLNIGGWWEVRDLMTESEDAKILEYFERYISETAQYFTECYGDDWDAHQALVYYTRSAEAATQADQSGWVYPLSYEMKTAFLSVANKFLHD